MTAFHGYGSLLIFTFLYFPSFVQHCSWQAGHGNLVINAWSLWNAYDKDWAVYLESGSNAYKAADIASNWQHYNLDFTNEGPIFTML